MSDHAALAEVVAPVPDEGACGDDAVLAAKTAAKASQPPPAITRGGATSPVPSRSSSTVLARSPSSVTA